MPTINALMKTTSLALISGILLAGCQAQPRPAASEEIREASNRSADWPAQGRRFVVDEHASELRIVVYADGPLARFGHPHVIGGAVLSGEVMLAEPFTDSALRLAIDVAALEVDRPAWRLDEGFDPDMTEAAIAGTKDNMLSASVLNASRFPSIEIESLGLVGPPWQPDIELRLHLAGNSRELTVPVGIEMNNNRLIASGRMLLSQREFGIEPFSAAGGSLAVADTLLVRFRILAIEADLP